MKVFISWSGERSQALAGILHERLPYILQYLDPWLSKSDIEAGERWSHEVAKQLEACSFGITCVTPENISSPWILFESGALAKSMQDGRVVPLLLDLNISDMSGPLAQFQAKKADKTGILDILQAINGLADTPLSDARLKPLYDALWPDFERAISEIPKIAGPNKKQRSQADVLEDLVESVRNLDLRYRETMESSLPSARRRQRGMDQMLIEEMAHRLGEGPGDPVKILLVVSQFKDEVPWLYELGVEYYRALSRTDQKETDIARHRFLRAIEVSSRMPPSEIMNDKSLYMAMRDLRRFVDDDFMRGREPSQRKARDPVITEFLDKPGEL